jgi:hypothetical protein
MLVAMKGEKPKDRYVFAFNDLMLITKVSLHPPRLCADVSCFYVGLSQLVLLTLVWRSVAGCDSVWLIYVCDIWHLTQLSCNMYNNSASDEAVHICSSHCIGEEGGEALCTQATRCDAPLYD